ncbi:MAG: hypothetical protein IPG44_06485 [Anaerolineales bacterium]|nr:hypothetical protein [Anaerolineales bacterium]
MARTVMTRVDAEENDEGRAVAKSASRSMTVFAATLHGFAVFAAVEVVDEKQ